MIQRLGIYGFLGAFILDIAIILANEGGRLNLFLAFLLSLLTAIFIEKIKSALESVPKEQVSWFSRLILTCIILLGLSYSYESLKTLLTSRLPSGWGIALVLWLLAVVWMLVVVPSVGGEKRKYG